VTQGTLNSNVLSTRYGTVLQGPDASGLEGFNWVAEVNGTSFAADSVMYGTGIETMMEHIPGNSTHSYQGHCRKRDDWHFSAPVTVSNGALESTHIEVWQGIDLSLDLMVVLDSATFLMSQLFQQYGNVSVTGYNAMTRPFVVVRWAWITLPGSIVLFGLVVFSLTVWETSRMQAPSWKASLLPLLYRYVDLDDNGARARSDPPAALADTSGFQGSNRCCGSNLVSDFEVDAEATPFRFAKNTSKWPVWQLESVVAVHPNEKIR
jgi:hypothetical protein